MTERYSDFNSMIEKYEREMRRIFEEKQKISFEEPSAKTAAFIPDSPTIMQYPKEQNNINIPEEKEQPDKTGTITVEVSTAKGVVPISDAVVLIDKLDVKDELGRKELLAVLSTNQSGRTNPLEVNAMPRDLSLEPGSSDPFTTFYVSAEKKGFEPVKNRPVDVFADEISILKIDLIPKPENLLEGGMSQW